MKFTFAHNNFNVIDLDKSLKFYDHLARHEGSLSQSEVNQLQELRCTRNLHMS